MTQHETQPNQYRTAQDALIDAARTRLPTPTWAEIARRLDVTQQTVNQWRRGDVPLSDERIEELAALAHADPGRWKMAIVAQRTKSAAIRKSLERFLGAAMLTAAAVLAPMETTQAARQDISGHSIHYANY
jgi:transcriptional regulator with XRE-family HTH domain